MVNVLPAFYFPTTIVFVDDNDLALKGFSTLLSSNKSLRLFNDPHKATNFFTTYHPQIKIKNCVVNSPDVEHDNFTVQTATQVDLSNILDLIDDTKKYDEISVLIADYQMHPELNGLDLCASLSRHSMKKMLLTDSQSFNVAKDGLNNKIIDAFINKTDTVTDIQETLYYLEMNYFIDLTTKILSHIDVGGNSPLGDSVFIENFYNIVRQYTISEFYLIDINGSFLLVDKQNAKRYILIVHTDASLSNAINILSEYPELSHVVGVVKEKKLIPFWGVGEEFDLKHASKVDGYLFEASVIDGKQRYYTHLLDLDSFNNQEPRVVI